MRTRRPYGGPAAAVVGALLAVLAVVAVVAGAGPAAAHGPASTLVRVALAEPSTATAGPVVRLTAKVALQQLDLAYDTDWAEQAAADGLDATVAAHADEVADLVLGRVSLVGDGGPWSLAVDAVGAGSDQGQDAVRVVLLATGPVGASGSVELTWGVVTDRVVTHDAYVGAVAADGTTELVATLTRADPSTTLTVDDPGAAAAPTTLWSVGWHHFREGADHLLFLALLALGTARRRSGWRVTARRLALLTLTFTAGHSLSLALAALGLVSVPGRWVEVAIAATIVVTALYTLRPRLPFGVEVAVTAAFGLVHGFGFAGTLTDLSLAGRRLVLPLLTFNLGLEAAQVAALLLVLVPLLVLARSAVASRLLAGAVGVVALSWVVERALGVANPLEPVLAVLLAGPERLALLLALAALACSVLTRRTPGGAGGAPEPAGTGSPRGVAVASVGG